MLGKEGTMVFLRLRQALAVGGGDRRHCEQTVEELLDAAFEAARFLRNLDPRAPPGGPEEELLRICNAMIAKAERIGGFYV